jgi:hypothetical protein
MGPFALSSVPGGNFLQAFASSTDTCNQYDNLYYLFFYGSFISLKISGLMQEGCISTNA